MYLTAENFFFTINVNFGSLFNKKKVNTRQLQSSAKETGKQIQKRRKER